LENTDAQGNVVLPGFLEYTKQSPLANPNTPTTKIMGNLEKTDSEKIFTIKTRLLGKTL
jgi:hypothetical protein